MHPLDWEGVRLLRTADGIYVFGSPSEAGPDRLWGLPVAQNSADDQGTGYTGSFQQAWISLVERRGIDVQIGYVNDQFKNGQRTVRSEEHTSEHKSLMRISYAVFCLKKKNDRVNEATQKTKL